MNIPVYGAVYVTDTTATTGSFHSIMIAGKGDANEAAEFANIQWGTTDQGGSTNTSLSGSGTVVVNVEISGSAVIPGPIFGFKLANGSVLAYYDKPQS